ncbi:MAG: hypothetical protein ACREP7_09270, partial [Lysobacter sp.]
MSQWPPTSIIYRRVAALDEEPSGLEPGHAGNFSGSFRAMARRSAKPVTGAMCASRICNKRHAPSFARIDRA